MSGLVGYDSSDEDKDIRDVSVGDLKTTIQPQPGSSLSNEAPSLPTNGHVETRVKSIRDASSEGLQIGPLVGPASTPVENGTASAPQSPYSANRAMIRDLTLPSHPNLDIPLSPPGSPPPGMNEKFGHFLELKKQGIHFNEKLARSSALKNPSLLRRLMDFAGLDEHDQYETTISRDVWDPTGFPSWAYKEELAKSQQEVLRKKEEERARSQRESIEFVSASVSGQSSRAGTPAAIGGKLGLRGSAAERVMAGLDRERRESPKISQGPGRSDSHQRDRRDGRVVGPDGGERRRSRSPRRRKRSRSR